jgi:uncharacterized Tic20 family protein
MENSDVIPTSPELSNEEKTWATFTHLSGLALYIGIPFGNVFGPLILWLIKRNEMPFVEDQGKEAINFQISMSIYLIVAGIAVFFIIGILALPVLFIVHIIFTIIAAVQANKGDAYRYPMTIRILK